MLRAAGTQGEHNRLHVGIDRGISWSNDRHDLLKLLAMERQHQVCSVGMSTKISHLASCRCFGCMHGHNSQA